MQGELHVNDTGVVIQSSVKDQTGKASNVSSATLIEFVFAKPNGTILTATGGFVSDGTDGLLQYTTINSDLDQAGEWRMQVYITLAQGILHTDWVNFKVLPNLR